MIPESKSMTLIWSTSALKKGPAKGQYDTTALQTAAAASGHDVCAETEDYEKFYRLIYCHDRLGAAT